MPVNGLLIGSAVLLSPLSVYDLYFLSSKLVVEMASSNPNKNGKLNSAEAHHHWIKPNMFLHVRKQCVFNNFLAVMNAKSTVS